MQICSERDGGVLALGKLSSITLRDVPDLARAWSVWWFFGGRRRVESVIVGVAALNSLCSSKTCRDPKTFGVSKEARAGQEAPPPSPQSIIIWL